MPNGCELNNCEYWSGQHCTLPTNYCIRRSDEEIIDELDSNLTYTRNLLQEQQALIRELKQVLQDFINAISKKVALTKYDTEVINVKKTLEKAEEKSTIEILKEEMKNKKNVDIQENKMFPRA